MMQTSPSPDDGEYQKFTTPSKRERGNPTTVTGPSNEANLLRASFAMLVVSILLLGLDLTTLRQQIRRAPREKAMPNQLPDASATTTTSSNRTLLVILGSLRGGELAWSTLYDNVLDPNQADLALMIGRVPTDRKASSMYQRAKYVWEFDEYDNWADAMDLINGSEWRSSLAKFLPSKSHLLGGMELPNTTSVGSGAIIFMIRWFLSNEIRRNDLTSRYDRFVLTRADHYYLCVHNLSLLSQNDLWIPDGEDYGGITDRHLVVSSRDVLNALNILPGLLKNPGLYEQCISEKHCNAETLIKKRWEAMGLVSKVRRFPRMMFTCATEGDTTRWKKMSTEIVPEGVHLKYKSEYYESHENCLMPVDMPVHHHHKAKKGPIGKSIDEKSETSKPVLGDDRIIHLEWHPTERKDRFPSVDERVRLYMSNWYLPPCDSSSQFAYKINPSSETHQYKRVKIEQPLQPQLNQIERSDRLVEVSSDFLSGEVFNIENKTILGCDREDAYCQDLNNDAIIFGVGTIDIPVLACLGDSKAEALLLHSDLRAPLLSKYRGATPKKQLFDVTHSLSLDAKCFDIEERKRLMCNARYENELDLLMPSTSKTKKPFAPIIWKLNTARHFGKELDVARDSPISWEDKIPKAIWRGTFSGRHRATKDERRDIEKACQYILRCNFVKRYNTTNDMIDAGFHFHMVKNEMYKWADENGLTKDKMTIEQQLQYKILISLEGNDVSSGLKWMLLSNSVVMMPLPTRTSWAMEELLQPFVHYVPMAEDGSDAEEKVQWILNNDMEAQRIAERATLFMEDMLYHPDAKRDELEVKKEIMRRYREHWRPMPDSL